MKTTVVDPMKCATCGEEHSAYTSMNCDARPEPGCYTICANCGALYRFGEGLSLTSLTSEELETFSPADRKTISDLQAQVIAASHIAKSIHPDYCAIPTGPGRFRLMRRRPP